MNTPAPTTEDTPCCILCGRKLTSGRGIPATLGLIGPECARKEGLEAVSQLMTHLPGQAIAEGQPDAGRAINALRGLGFQITCTEIEGGWRIEAVTLPAPARPARKGWGGAVLAHFTAKGISALVTRAFPALEVQ